MQLKPILVALLVGISLISQAQRHPSFAKGQDPKPTDKRWKLVKELSDEFKGKKLNTKKWQNTDPKGWIGRAPGIFKKDAVSLKKGKLCLTNYKLDQAEIQHEKTFTHAGAHVMSKKRAKPGYYVECSMKANKTFMSSTFWLINKKSEGEGCDKRTTELDIQECVGYVNTDKPFAKLFDEAMHSNTHSRGTTCKETPTGTQGNHAKTSTKVYADYHTYAVWWKSPTEVLFFLDGKHQYTVQPKAEFNLEMYLKLVTETYNWNPVPADGGMTGNWKERTTFYDWVRVWELVD